MCDVFTGQTKPSIKHWPIKGGITIYPHVVTNKYSTHDEMRSYIMQIAKMHPELNITMYEESTFCSELNGQWNVVFTTYDPAEPDVQNLYMLRRCKTHNETHGCPLQKVSRCYPGPGQKAQRILNARTKKDHYDKIESALKTIWGAANTRNTHNFPTYFP